MLLSYCYSYQDCLQLKKIKRSTPQDISDDVREFLSSTTAALLQKMKWDDEDDYEDIDEDDKHAFESLRKVCIQFMST